MASRVNTPTGLTNQTLVEYITALKGPTGGSEFATAFAPYAKAAGFTVKDVLTQLKEAGLSASQAHEAVYGHSSTLQNIFQQAGLAFITGPVASVGGNDPTIAPAEGDSTTSPSPSTGLPSGIPSALGSLLSKYGSALVFIPILEWLTTGKNWVRVLEYVGGAVMIGIAFRELAKQ